MPYSASARLLDEIIVEVGGGSAPTSRTAPTAPPAAAPASAPAPAPAKEKQQPAGGKKEKKEKAPAAAPAAPAAPEAPAAPDPEVERKFALVRSVGEECVTDSELKNLFKKPNFILYDGFEPSGLSLIHI